MKRIGILSDTHACWDDKFLLHFNDCDEIWHAGDIGSPIITDRLAEHCKIRAVCGNIDGQELRLKYDKILCFTIEDCKVLMTHIGGYPRHYQPKALQHIHASRPKIFIAGHSHILKVIYDPVYDLLFINPGAAGIYGIHRTRTAVRFDIEAGEIKNMEIGEWPKM